MSSLGLASEKTYEHVHFMSGDLFFKEKPRCLRGFKVVARDGIEPPTPAFSGLRSTH